MKDDQLTPRMTQTAKGLWIVYFALTLACFVAVLARRHVVDRRADPQLHDAFARRLLLPRREHRLFRFARDRGRRDRLHDARGHQLRDAFPRLAGAQLRRRAHRQRAAVLPRACSRRASSVITCFLWLRRRLSGLLDGAALRARSTRSRSRPTPATRRSTTRSGRCSRRCGSCSSGRSSRARAPPAAASR